MSLAQHHAVADDWEERAPELRAAIREAAAKARDAAEDVRHLASAHNAEREAIRMRLNGVKDPSGRIFISPFRFKVGRETLRSIDAEAVLRAAIAKTPGDRFPIDLLADVNPNEPQRLPGSLAAERDPYPQAPRPPELTDDQIEAAVTRGHVRRSPFVQRSE